MRKRLTTILVTIAFVVGFSTVSWTYYHFVKDTIYAESTSHLSEIYHQANQAQY